MTITITDAEREVMRILWAENPLTSRQIIDRSLTIGEWKEGTIKSLLSRLIAKGAIYKDTQQSPYLFTPTIPQQDATHTALAQCLASTCQKDRGAYLAHLIEHQPLSQADCEQLIQRLQEKKQHAPLTVACNCLAGQCSCHHQKGEHL